MQTFFTGSREQRKALLLTLNKPQTNDLGEILGNVFLEISDFKLIQFVDERKGWRKRRALIEDHYLWILRVLEKHKDFILDHYQSSEGSEGSDDSL